MAASSVIIWLQKIESNMKTSDRDTAGVLGDRFKTAGDDCRVSVKAYRWTVETHCLNVGIRLWLLRPVTSKHVSLGLRRGELGRGWADWQTGKGSTKQTGATFMKMRGAFPSQLASTLLKLGVTLSGGKGSYKLSWEYRVQCLELETPKDSKFCLHVKLGLRNCIRITFLLLLFLWNLNSHQKALMKGYSFSFRTWSCVIPLMGGSESGFK